MTLFPHCLSWSAIAAGTLFHIFITEISKLFYKKDKKSQIMVNLGHMGVAGYSAFRPPALAKVFI
jgi:hypothetical protein